MDSGHATMTTVSNEQVPVNVASQHHAQQQQVSGHVLAANDRSATQARLRRPSTPPVRLER